MKIFKAAPIAFFYFALTSTVHADPFLNGGFENGTTSGWTTGQGYRGGLLNSEITPAGFLPGAALYDGSAPRSTVVDAGYVDPNVGAALGATVYAGNHAFRAEDTTSGGNASVISQQVLNYTDPNIFFAWKAVLEDGSHTADQSAEMVITLIDDTTGTQLLSRVYNAGAGGGGVDNRFAALNGFFYTPDWQIEQITIDPALAGHDFTLSLLAADCALSGHAGYAYLDGFAAAVVDPGSSVPEPGSAALLLLGAGALARARRRKAS